MNNSMLEEYEEVLNIFRCDECKNLFESYTDESLQEICPQCGLAGCYAINTDAYNERF